MTARAELTILGDDAYLYKLAGTDATRNVMVMSHHDVVDAAGEWQEPPFGGDSKDGKLWAAARWTPRRRCSRSLPP